MMLDVAPQVSWIASRTNQSADSVLQQIYEHAAPAAKLMCRGERLAGSSWVSRYADIVIRQAGIDGPESNSLERLPRRASDAFHDLLYHPSTPKDRGKGALLILGLVAVIAVFFLFTDPSALLGSGFGVLALIALAFLLFIGSLMGYAWIRQRLDRHAGTKP
jgi:hypothetical protein